MIQLQFLWFWDIIIHLFHILTIQFFFTRTWNLPCYTSSRLLWLWDRATDTYNVCVQNWRASTVEIFKLIYALHLYFGLVSPWCVDRSKSSAQIDLNRRKYFFSYLARNIRISKNIICIYHCFFLCNFKVNTDLNIPAILGWCTWIHQST